MLNLSRINHVISYSRTSSGLKFLWVIHDQNLQGLIPEIMTWMAVPK